LYPYFSVAHLSALTAEAAPTVRGQSGRNSPFGKESANIHKVFEKLFL